MLAALSHIRCTHIASLIVLGILTFVDNMIHTYLLLMTLSAGTEASKPKPEQLGDLEDLSCREILLNDSVTGLIVQQFIGSGYDRSVIPKLTGVDVQVELVIQVIWEVSETTSTFTADFMFSQIWMDHRLAYEKVTNCVRNITVANSYLKEIWIPNICIINSKETSIHQSPTTNTFFMLYPNGTVWINQRVKQSQANFFKEF